MSGRVSPIGPVCLEYEIIELHNPRQLAVAAGIVLVPDLHRSSVKARALQHSPETAGAASMHAQDQQRGTLGKKS
jgi:hypothetical protein